MFCFVSEKGNYFSSTLSWDLQICSEHIKTADKNKHQNTKNINFMTVSSNWIWHGQALVTSNVLTGDRKLIHILHVA